MKKKCYWILFFVFLVGAGCGESPPAKPKLVVVLVVDQMRPDHLTRFTGLYEHGFARLRKNGAIFTNAYHDHAYTKTGAGHATIATGVFPSHHGVIGNSWFEQTLGRKVNCCEDTVHTILGYPDEARQQGRSPSNLLRPTLGDLLKAVSPKSKVFGVSRKDRAAIFLAGKKADAAYWYHSRDGKFVTSRYYLNAYPHWVQEFNHSRWVDTYFAAGWHKLLPEAVYSRVRPDSFHAENGGKQTAFPHLFTTTSSQPDSIYYKKLLKTPFADELTLAFAKKLVEEEQLGMDEFPDILNIGCSSSDPIGHNFGPYSQESMDHFLRLDRYLEDFFSFLDEKIGPENYLIVLSSDHGVLPLPEALAARGVDARRLSPSDAYGKIRQAAAAVAKRLGIEEDLIAGRSGYGLFIRYPAAGKKKVAPQKLDALLVEALKTLPFIEDVFTKDELLFDSGEAREYQTAFRHSFHPERSADLTFRIKKYHLIKKSGTDHGTPYDYDTHVPIVFYGAGAKAGRITQTVKTVDIAPTLAEILGLQPVQMDGRSLWDLIMKTKRMKLWGIDRSEKINHKHFSVL